MSQYDDENVLVIKRSLFDKLGSFEGFNADVSRYLPAFLDPRNNFFLSRDLAENDPSHKQIIPYAIFHKGNKVLRYYRGGGSGEKRLASKASIGIGGHINDDDHAASSLDRDTYTVGVEREIQEELHINCSYSQRIIGLINDDSNEVGRVHLGVVHLVSLENEAVRANEDNVVDLQFLPYEELNDSIENLETWSSICLKKLPGFIGIQAT